MASRSRLLRSTLALGAVSAVALALLVAPGAEDVASANEPTTLLDLDFEAETPTPSGPDGMTTQQVRDLFDSPYGDICAQKRCAVVKRADDEAASPTGDEYGKVQIETDGTGNTYLVKTVRQGAYADDAGIDTDRLSLKWDLDQPVDKLYLQYDVRVGQSWSAASGGKLPGLCGGTCPAGGGPVADANGKALGFSARGNFYYTDSQNRSGLSQYLYHVGKTTTHGDNRLYLLPATTTSPTPSPVTLSTSWKTVTHMIKMNTVTNGTGNTDGRMVAWVDGVKVYQSDSMRWRDSTTMKVDAMLFAHMFGGGNPSLHAAPAGARVMFDNVRITTTQPAGLTS